jgi:hypothetical protein
MKSMILRTDSRDTTTAPQKERSDRSENHRFMAAHSTMNDTGSFRAMVNDPSVDGRSLFSDEMVGARTMAIVNAIIVFGIIIPNTIIFAILEFFRHSYGKIVVLDTVVSTAVIINFFWFLKSKNSKTFSYINLLFLTMLFLGLFILGGTGNSGFLWSLVFPLIALFMLGARAGTIVVSLFFCAILVIFFVPLDRGAPLITFDLMFKLRFLGVFLCLLFTSLLYEFMRKRSQKDVHLKNSVLERAIREIRFKGDNLRFLSDRRSNSWVFPRKTKFTSMSDFTSAN